MMAFRWILLFINIIITIINWMNFIPLVQGQCSYETTCEACLNSTLPCGWCTELGTCENVGETDCAPDSWNYKPSQIENTTTSSNLNVNPTQIDLFLRPGSPITFNVTVVPQSALPVDVYMLFDFSDRMDMSDLLEMSQVLVDQILQSSSNSRIGFGSFIDKNVQPFALSDAYAFNNTQSLTSDYQLVRNNLQLYLQESNLVGIFSGPVSGLDAMLQAILCYSQINWRVQSQKIVVYASNSGYHVAGDGLLGGITNPNQGICEMTTNNQYNSLEYDYPSLGQLSRAVKMLNIYPIFMVSTPYYDTIGLEAFETLVQVLGQGIIGDLSNPQEIGSLFQNAYHATINGINPTILLSPLPSGSVTINPPLLSQIIPGVPETFEISILYSASSPITPPNNVLQISFSSFGLLTINLDTTFECNCPDDCARCTSAESNTGACICGRCVCNPPYVGVNCSCDASVGTMINSVSSCSNYPYSVDCDACYCPGALEANCSDLEPQCSTDCYNGYCDAGLCICDSGYDPANNCRYPVCQVCLNGGICIDGQCNCLIGFLPPTCASSTFESEANGYCSTFNDKLYSECIKNPQQIACGFCFASNSCIPAYLNSSCPPNQYMDYVPDPDYIYVAAAFGAALLIGLAGTGTWKGAIVLADRKAWKEFHAKKANLNPMFQANPAYRKASVKVNPEVYHDNENENEKSSFLKRMIMSKTSKASYSLFKDQD